MNEITMNAEFSGENKKDFFAWMRSHGVPEWLVSRMETCWRNTMRVLSRGYSVAESIIRELVRFAPKHKHLCTGAAVGLIATMIISQVPLLGWIIGPLVGSGIILAVAYLGHLYDNPGGGMITFIGVMMELFGRLFNAAVK